MHSGAHAYKQMKTVKKVYIVCNTTFMGQFITYNTMGRNDKRKISTYTYRNIEIE